MVTALPPSGSKPDISVILTTSIALIEFEPIGFGAGACVTVTSTGLPVAPVVAVTQMVAVLSEVLVFASKPQLIVPELVPLAPDMIRSQPLAGVTSAVHGMVPVPVFETLNVVAPASLATFRLTGLTEMTEESNGPACPPRTARTYKRPYLLELRSWP